MTLWHWCQPCMDGQHDLCDPVPFCECFEEVLIDEEASSGE